MSEMTSQGFHTGTSPVLNGIVIIRSLDFTLQKWPGFNKHLKYVSQFHGCVYGMAVNVTGSAARKPDKISHGDQILSHFKLYLAIATLNVKW